MLEGADVSVLQHVFRFRIAAGNGAGGAIKPLVVAPHDHLEQAGVAREHTFDYLLIRELRVPCGSVNSCRLASVSCRHVHAGNPTLQLDESDEGEGVTNHFGCNPSPD